MSLGYSTLDEFGNTPINQISDQSQQQSQQYQQLQSQFEQQQQHFHQQQQQYQQQQQTLPTYDFCPNARNPYHWCTPYCYHHYGPKKQSVQPSQQQTQKYRPFSKIIEPTNAKPRYKKINGIWYQLKATVVCQIEDNHHCSIKCPGLTKIDGLYKIPKK